jgi:hypothetical protein
MKAALLSVIAASTGLAHAKLRPCTSATIPPITVFGIEVLSIHVTERANYADWIPSPAMSIPVGVQSVSFCNVTVTYTHPGQNDTIQTWIFLPLDDEDWNGRYLGNGGGGYVTGVPDALFGPVSQGYAAASTDGGHTVYGDGLKIGTTSDWWALLSPGNLNWVHIQDFASRALGDMPKIAKQIIEGFYGTPPKFSYWNGCSTGGRQGMMVAQRFPEEYDGIMAAAPAINWASFLIAELWPLVAIRKAGYCPPTCEFAALTQAAIKHCDKLDGVEDGIIGAPGLCDFDATSVVGQKFDCDGQSRKISAKGAEVVSSMWKGPHDEEGKRGWFGMTHETPVFISAMGEVGGMVRSICDDKNENCKPAPFPISADYPKFWVRKDPEWTLDSLDEEEFWKLLHDSRNEFGSIIDTSDPDLSALKAKGGKLISWHGLADQLIMVNGSSDYYSRVEALDKNVRDFFRYFEAPGVFHCMGGPGAEPGISALEAVVKWVEEGVAPETLPGKSTPMDGESATVRHRPLCPYPLVAAYKGGDANRAESFACAEGFEKFKALWGAHGEL